MRMAAGGGGANYRQLSVGFIAGAIFTVLIISSSGGGDPEDTTTAAGGAADAARCAQLVKQRLPSASPATAGARPASVAPGAEVDTSGMAASPPSPPAPLESKLGASAAPGATDATGDLWEGWLGGAPLPLPTPPWAVNDTALAEAETDPAADLRLPPFADAGFDTLFPEYAEARRKADRAARPEERRVPRCTALSPPNVFPNNTKYRPRTNADSGVTGRGVAGANATVLFFANKPWRYSACNAVATALHQGYRVRISGENSLGLFGKGHKKPQAVTIVTAQSLADVPPDEVVVLADTGDTMFTHGPAVLHASLRRLFRRLRATSSVPYGAPLESGEPTGFMGRTVLVSGEINSLIEHPPTEYPRSTFNESRFRYAPFPNTGIFIGHPNALVAAFKKAFNYTLAAKYIRIKNFQQSLLAWNDQALLTILAAKEGMLQDGTILVDHYSEIAMNGFAPFKKSYSMHLGMMEHEYRYFASDDNVLWYPERNSRTETFPMIVHFNGPAKMHLARHIRCYYRNAAASDWVFDVDSWPITVLGEKNRTTEIMKSKKAMRDRRNPLKIPVNITERRETTLGEWCPAWLRESMCEDTKRGNCKQSHQMRCEDCA